MAENVTARRTGSLKAFLARSRPKQGQTERGERLHQKYVHPMCPLLE